MKLTALTIAILFGLQALAQTNDCSERADKVTMLFLDIIKAKETYLAGMKQVPLDMEARDLICARDHMNETLTNMKAYLDLTIPTLEIVNVDYCEAFKFSEIKKILESSQVVVTDQLYAWGEASRYVFGAAKEIDPTFSKKCAAPLLSAKP